MCDELAGIVAVSRRGDSIDDAVCGAHTASNNLDHICDVGGAQAERVRIGWEEVDEDTTIAGTFALEMRDCAHVAADQDGYVKRIDRRSAHAGVSLRVEIVKAVHARLEAFGNTLLRRGRSQMRIRLTLARNEHGLAVATLDEPMQRPSVAI